MKRTKNLENVLYKRKYKNIYKIVFTADLDNVSDFSNWHKQNQGYIEQNRPLWIICESQLIGKRIWITEEFGELQITIADLNLDVSSSQYSESFKHILFKNQNEMVKTLKELLKPCLELQVKTKNEEIDIEENIEM